MLATTFSLSKHTCLEKRGLRLRGTAQPQALRNPEPGSACAQRLEITKSRGRSRFEHTGWAKKHELKRSRSDCSSC